MEHLGSQLSYHGREQRQARTAAQGHQSRMSVWAVPIVAASYVLVCIISKGVSYLVQTSRTLTDVHGKCEFFVVTF